MLLNRDELIATLFRETDRAQRLKTGLAVILCGIDGLENWRSRLGEYELHTAEQEITKRIVRVLRCYDSLARFDDDTYALVLPGCNSFNAVGMAERLRQDLTSSAVNVGGEALEVSATFGIAGSGGRSPLVVLRNAVEALSSARTQKFGSIVRSSYDAEPDPATFWPPVIEDEALHW